jgi:RHS repeat-associated protein
LEEFLYTGKLLDVVTGLYYFGSRFYDEAVGRFITEDSSSGGREDPLSLNRYAYARENPMRFVDLGGHSTVESDCEDDSCYWGGEASSTTAYVAPPSAASLAEPTVVINVEPTTTAASTATSSSGGNPPSSTSTTCAASVDQCLTEGGGNQYSTTTGGSTQGSTFGLESGSNFQVSLTPTLTGTESLSQQLNKGIVGAGGAAMVAGVAIGAVLSVAATVTFASFAPFALLAAVAFGAGFALGYVLRNGAQSTPQGTIAAFVEGTGMLAEILIHVVSGQQLSFPP